MNISIYIYTFVKISEYDAGMEIPIFNVRDAIGTYTGEG